MKISLSPAQAENFFYNSLCNSLGYISSYGLELNYETKHYKEARHNLIIKTSITNEMVCFEDVLMEILKMGNTLTLIDNEGDGYYTKSITLKDVHEQVENTPIKHLMDAINEHDDATTGDVIIQQVFFNEIIFG
jgi:hypothetical protein